ncbi:CDP-diacylglycerol--glycerol-3-phosphate 3-phosphatidyltransferase [Fusibacter bizertensis]
MKNIPNILTAIRLALVPVFPIVYFSNYESAHYLALIIFIFAGVTDFLDGYIARRYQYITPFGTVFDPLADKLMLLTALISLYSDRIIPFWVLLIMLIKELFMIVAGIYLYMRKAKLIIPSNVFGKLATVVFSLAIALLLLTPNTHWLQYLVITAVGFKLIAFTSYVTFMYSQRKST